MSILVDFPQQNSSCGVHKGELTYIDPQRLFLFKGLIRGNCFFKLGNPWSCKPTFQLDNRRLGLFDCCDFQRIVGPPCALHLLLASGKPNRDATLEICKLLINKMREQCRNRFIEVRRQI